MAVIVLVFLALAATAQAQSVLVKPAGALMRARRAPGLMPSFLGSGVPE